MTTSLNWPALAAEAVRYLQDLLRIDTTNPPGNELAAAEYLADVLRTEGYDPIVLEAAPQRGNMIARLKGDGSLPPLLLYTHTDVVPAAGLRPATCALRPRRMSGRRSSASNMWTSLMTVNARCCRM